MWFSPPLPYPWNRNSCVWRADSSTNTFCKFPNDAWPPDSTSVPNWATAAPEYRRRWGRRTWAGSWRVSKRTPPPGWFSGFCTAYPRASKMSKCQKWEWKGRCRDSQLAPKRTKAELHTAKKFTVILITVFWLNSRPALFQVNPFLSNVVNSNATLIFDGGSPPWMNRSCYYSKPKR